MTPAPAHEPAGVESLPALNLPARWEEQLPATPESVPTMRRGVVAFARSHGAESSALADIALAVSEAVTNSVLHAFVDREPGTVRVVAEPLNEALLVRVIDDGRGMQPRSDSPGMRVGLPTIGSLTSTFDIRQGPDGTGTEVRMVFPVAGMRGPVRVGSLVGDRLDLLAEVTRLAEGGGWPDAGMARLADVLVPDLAEVCTIDLVDDDGHARRLAARVADPHGPELSRWLAGRRPPTDRPGTATFSAVRTRTSTISECEPGEVRRPRPEGEPSTAAVLGVRFWVSVPVHDGSGLLGVIGLGLRPPRPRPDAEDVAFFELLAERAARGLANTALLEELDRTRRRLEGILENLAEAITVQDESGRTVYANPAAARLLGLASPAEVVAHEPGELADRFVITHEDGSPVALDEFPGRRLLTGVDAPPLLTRSVDRRTGLARWLLTKATLLDGGDAPLAVNVIEDVTEAKDAELRHRFLAEAGELLASSLDYETTLEHVAGLIVPQLADWCAVDLLVDGELRRLALAHVDPEKVEFARRLHEAYPPDLDSDRGIGPILRGGGAELYEDIPDDLLALGARDAEHLSLLRSLGMRSALLLPIRVGDRTLGVLTLVNAESARAFGAEDLEFAGHVARRAAVAIENARRFRELGG